MNVNAAYALRLLAVTKTTPLNVNTPYAIILWVVNKTSLYACGHNILSKSIDNNETSILSVNAAYILR